MSRHLNEQLDGADMDGAAKERKLEAVSSNALFADWWSEMGSLPPLPDEDHAEHTERIAHLAFNAGANPWRLNAGKWWCQYCLSVVEPECVTFEECHDPRSGGCDGPVQIIPANRLGINTFLQPAWKITKQ